MPESSGGAPGKHATIDMEAFLAAHEERTTLRFITCGSVDDGKSTLIGRLLYESQLILDDQMAALEKDSRKMGTQGDDFDFALLVDGLQAEREQGITIDVAYRYFTTANRQFIVADTPGHEQYTRNMVTGASTADLAVILVDATKGLVTQTHRHTHLIALMGISQVVLAVNKLDLVDYDRSVFTSLAADHARFAHSLGIGSVTAIPLSALRGDNLTVPSVRTPWYDGPTLIEALEQAPVGDGNDLDRPFRMPVQLAIRPDSGFRGYGGRITSGDVAPGDRVVVLPSGTTTTVARVVTADGDLDRAESGRSVTLTFADEIDASRGDLVCGVDEPSTVTDQVEASLVWMSETPLVPGRRYLVRIGSATTGATVTRLKYRVDIDTGERESATELALNDIGVANVSFDAPVALDSYADDRDLGGFILIDRLTNHTIAAGMVHFGLRRGENVQWQHTEVNARARAELNGHRAAVVWLTGLSGSGKSTIANVLERKLHHRGVHTYLLDGDNVRHGLNRDLGFTEADRAENIRRIGEVADLFADAGLVVIAAFISPYRAERQAVRDLVGPGTFCEVHVDTPIDVAESPDPTGLDAKARRGELQNFTGIDAPYEPPTDPEIRVDTSVTTPEDAADLIIAHLEATGVFHRP